MQDIDDKIKKTEALEKEAWDKYQSFKNSPEFLAAEKQKDDLASAWHQHSKKLEALRLLKGELNETK